MTDVQMFKDSAHENHSEPSICKYNALAKPSRVCHSQRRKKSKTETIKKERKKIQLKS